MFKWLKTVFSRLISTRQEWADESGVISTTSSVGNLLTNYFIRTALETLQKTLVLDQFSIMTPLPKGTGKTVFWNRFQDMGWPSHIGTEGNNPTPVGLSTDRVSAVIRQRGMIIDNSDLLDYTSVCNVTENSVILAAYSGAKLVDTSILMTFFQADALNTRRGGSTTGTWLNPSGFAPVTATGAAGLSNWLSGLSTFNGTRMLSGDGTHAISAVPVIMGPGFGDATRNAFRMFSPIEMSGTGSSVANLSTTVGAGIGGPFPLKAKDIKRCVEKLEEFDIPRFEDGYYVGVINAANKRTITSDSDWTDAYKYTDPTNMYKGEAGTFGGVRFIQSENILTFDISGITTKAGSVSFPVIFGKGAYGMTKLDGGVSISRIPATPQRGDELGLKSSVGLKVQLAPVVLNKSAGIIIMTTHGRTRAT